MVLEKLGRGSHTPVGWRSATVEEARDNLESVKRDNLLEEWDKVRLLDGWIGGSAYDFDVEEGFRRCLGYMLLVQTQASHKSDAEDDRKAVPYSALPELSKEGENAAMLLCCEDYNEELLHWSVGRNTECDETSAASEVVSAIAREWQSFYAKSRSLSSLEVSGIKQSLKTLLGHTQKSFSALKIKNQNSKQGKIIDEILEELTLKSDLTEYLDKFREIFGGEVVAGMVWFVVVENMAWQAFCILCYKLYGEVAMHSDPFLRFLVLNAYAVSQATLKEFSESFKSAGNGDFKRFAKILRDQRYALFSCKAKLDVLSIHLLWAARQGDLNGVKRLLESRVHPSPTNNNVTDTLQRPGSVTMTLKWTPLHYAAFNGNHRMWTLLIYHNATMTAKDTNGWTPLHKALSLRNDNVVHVLLLAKGGTGLLNDGGPLIYLAARWQVREDMIALMLSLCIQPESHFGELRNLSVYLRESSRMGYVDLIQKLLDGGADPFQGDGYEGKTALHYAAEGEDENVALQIIEKLLLEKKQGSPNWEKISAGDKYRRNALHVAAFLGRRQLCCKLLKNNRNVIDTKDRDGQNALHYAVAGPHGNSDVSDLFTNPRKEATNIVSVTDFSQTTLLHVAAACGNLNMVQWLLEWIFRAEERKHYAGAADVLGQTALHKAASGGHVEVVKPLLEEGAHPLKERDSDANTALDFAAQADGKKAVTIAKLLLDKCESEKQKSLCLFASETGNGLPNSSLFEEYLSQEKGKLGETLMAENLLRVAATLGDADLTMECVSRGANISIIRNEQWRASLSREEEKNVQDVISKIKTIVVDQGTDKHAVEDNLGRSPFPIGLAAMFLNPFVKSPVTVGISGEWRMGKSSVMLQTEINLVKAAAQLAFKRSSGRGGSKLSVTGQGKHRKIANALETLDAEKRDGSLIIGHIRMSLQRVKNFTSKLKDEEEIRSANQTVSKIPQEEYSLQGTTPSILTVQYNAWHYRNETEAWAGLAVEITKELEAIMTVAHKLRTSCTYNWRNRKNIICFGVILPFFLALTVAIWFSTIVRFVFDTGKHKDLKKLKYGGLLASMIVAA